MYNQTQYGAVIEPRDTFARATVLSKSPMPEHPADPVHRWYMELQ